MKQFIFITCIFGILHYNNAQDIMPSVIIDQFINNEVAKQLELVNDGFLITGINYSTSLAEIDGEVILKTNFEGIVQNTIFENGYPPFENYHIRLYESDSTFNILNYFSSDKVYDATFGLNGDIIDTSIVSDDATNDVVQAKDGSYWVHKYKYNTTQAEYVFHVEHIKNDSIYSIPLDNTNGWFIDLVTMEAINDKLLLVTLTNQENYKFQLIADDGTINDIMETEFVESIYSYNLGAKDNLFIEVLSDSTFAFAHRSFDQTFLKTYHINGTELWSTVLWDSQGHMTQHIQRTKDNGLLVVGCHQDYGTIWKEKAWICKTDSIGQLLWKRKYQATYSCSFQDVVEMPNGNLTIAGSIRYPDTINDNQWYNIFSIWLFTTDSLGCQKPECSDSEIIIVDDIPSATNEISDQNGRIYKILPNPANQQIQLKFADNYIIQADDIVIVYDIYGKVLQKQNIYNSQTIDVQHLNNGIYIIQLQTKAGNSITQKCIIQH